MSVLQNASPHVTTVLAGNKCESSDRIVDEESGKKMAENFELPFFEVSCKDDVNIENAFITLARKIRETREMKGDPFREKDDTKGQSLKCKTETEETQRPCSSC